MLRGYWSAFAHGYVCPTSVFTRNSKAAVLLGSILATILCLVRTQELFLLVNLGKKILSAYHWSQAC